MLGKGTLWQSILRTTEQALATGALRSFPTDRVFIEDGGVRFFIRIMAALRQKADARSQQDESAKAGRNIDPFLPPEKDLTVTDVTDTHIAVLNKYNVVDHHLLIITRHFEDQRTLLTLRTLKRSGSAWRSTPASASTTAAGRPVRARSTSTFRWCRLPWRQRGRRSPSPLSCPFVLDRSSRDRARAAFSPLLRAAPARRRGAPPRSRAPRHSTLRRHAFPRRMDAPRAAGLSSSRCPTASPDARMDAPRAEEPGARRGHLPQLSCLCRSFFVANAQQFERLNGFGPMHALQAAAFPGGGCDQPPQLGKIADELPFPLGKTERVGRVEGNVQDPAVLPNHAPVRPGDLHVLIQHGETGRLPEQDDDVRPDDRQLFDEVLPPVQDHRLDGVPRSGR